MVSIKLWGGRSITFERETIPEDWKVTIQSWTQVGWDEGSERMMGEFTFRAIGLEVCTPKRGVVARLNLAPKRWRETNQ